MLSPFRGAELTGNIAPIVQTERLVLRHVRATDVDYFAETQSDEEIMRHLGGPLSREDSWRRALTGAGLWGVLGIGLWVVDRQSDGRTIGQIGFFDFQRDINPSIAGQPEMGWIFSREGQGQGLATEAGRGVLDWFDKTLGAQAIPAIIDIKNEPSMRLAERLGFERQPDGTYRNEPIAIFRREPR
ncbi:MAG TPA: GNAT family N-acetyltransferase [Sphingomicrobium sp.]|nr:GNAT family N-acetyltransferase [Sphingomicrobium sp.]